MAYGFVNPVSFSEPELCFSEPEFAGVLLTFLLGADRRVGQGIFWWACGRSNVSGRVFAGDMNRRSALVAPAGRGCPAGVRVGVVRMSVVGCSLRS